MKKIIIAVAAVAMAIVANASAVDWKLTTGSTYASHNVYSLANVTAAVAQTALESKTASNWTALLGSTTPAVASTGNRGYASSFNEGVAANDTLLFVILDGDIAAGTKYYVLNPATIPAANLYEPPATGTQLQLSAATLGVAAQGTLAVPEPTSGLLIVLGMAGLALRRRRA